MESCSNWLVDNNLSLHLGKTECVLFGPRRKLNNIKSFNVKGKEQVIKSQDSVRYLGLCIDKYMNCEKIVNSIIGKVNSRLKFLYRNYRSLNSSTRLTLSTALIQCYFDYSCSSWYGGLNKSLKYKLQVAKNKVIRFILNLKPMTRISFSILSEIEMLKVEDRAKQLRSNHVFIVYHELAPQCLNQHFLREADSHSYRTRGSLFNFVVPSIKSCDSHTFYNNAILDWNSLSDDIKSITNKPSYKTAVKRHLLTAGQSREAGIHNYF